MWRYLSPRQLCRFARSTNCCLRVPALPLPRTFCRRATNQNHKREDPAAKPGATDRLRCPKQQCAGYEWTYRLPRYRRRSHQRTAAACAFDVEKGNLFAIMRPTRSRCVAVKICELFGIRAIRFHRPELPLVFRSRSRKDRKHFRIGRPGGSKLLVCRRSEF